MTEPRPVISRDVLDLARETGDGGLPPGAARRARSRFEEALGGAGARSEARVRRSFRRAWTPLFAVAALALVLVAGAVSMRLRFAVTGAPLADGNFVRAADEAPATISFSDGTRVEVEASSSVRVADAGLRGADLVQERGRAMYSVVHRPVASWSVEAGPYRVRVTGTRFSVAWSPESGTFVAELYEGSVTIEGPNAGAGVQLRGGQRLRADASGAIVVEEMIAGGQSGDSAAPGDTQSAGASGSDDGEAAPSGAKPATGAPPAGSGTVGGSGGSGTVGGSGGSGGSAPSDKASPDPSSAAGPAGATDAAPRTLAERLAQGEASTIAAELEREGVASFAARASAGDLAIAADAARYSGK
ncbi:MAG: FecR family protein, partial [Polyangiaceae bacterium]